jgi:hypothetical protein
MLKLMPGLLPLEFCHYFTHLLLRNRSINPHSFDSQLPTATFMGKDLAFETLQERLWPLLESQIGVPLLPTYAYARLYTNGDVLEPHFDRPACEVSMTLQLGRSHHYSWPIYMDGQRFDLAEGDAIVYPGCDVKHWREVCDGPPDYYSGQVFLHFVRANGENTACAGDGRTTPDFYNRIRTLAMESK